MNKTIKTPGTVREFADMAHEMGVSVVDLLEMLGPIPMPPAGYTLAEDSDDRWIGTETMNRGWIITPVWTWNSTGGTHSIDLWTARNTASLSADTALSPAEALELAADLRAAAQAILAAGGTN